MTAPASCSRPGLGLALGLMASFALSASACDSKGKGKAQPVVKTEAAPKALDGSGELAPTKLAPGGRASPASKRVVNANPGLVGKVKTPTPASAPKTINFDGKTRRDIVDQLGYTVPSQWTTQTPENRMRLAQYDLPGAGGGASLVLYRFPGGGGSAEQNIGRWIGQFKQPDGSDTKAKTVVEKATVGEFQVTRVDIAGTFEAAPMGPGAKAEGPKPDTRMLAAIVEGVGNPYFFKLVGPAKTVETWAPSFQALVVSFKKGQ